MRTIRLLKTSSPYEGHLQGAYAQQPTLAQLSSAEQQEALLRQFFGWGDAWKHYLEETGRFRVEDVIINAEPIRDAWAREHGLPGTPGLEEFVEHLISEFQPEVWFCHSFQVSASFRRRMRRQYPALRLVIGYDGVRLHDVKELGGCDMVLTCLQATADFYQRAGMAGHLLPYGFDERVLPLLPAGSPRFEVCFLGGIRLSRTGHNRRIEILQDVAAAVPLDLWLAERPTAADAWRTAASFAKRLQIGSLASHVKRCIRLPKLLGSANPGVYGLEMYRVLAQSRIALNVHVDVAEAEAANIRLFETTGAGTCLVTDWKPNLASLFRLDTEIVAFRTADEAVEKIRYLLANEPARAGIAHRGQQRTLADHTVRDRLLTLASILEAA